MGRGEEGQEEGKEEEVRMGKAFSRNVVKTNKLHRRKTDLMTAASLYSTSLNGRTHSL